jgi:hypothetical protein
MQSVSLMDTLTPEKVIAFTGHASAQALQVCLVYLLRRQDAPTPGGVGSLGMKRNKAISEY